jgi:hypothetical protein
MGHVGDPGGSDPECLARRVPGVFVRRRDDQRPQGGPLDISPYELWGGGERGAVRPARGRFPLGADPLRAGRPVLGGLLHARPYPHQRALRAPPPRSGDGVLSRRRLAGLRPVPVSGQLHLASGRMARRAGGKRGRHRDRARPRHLGAPGYPQPGEPPRPGSGPGQRSHGGVAQPSGAADHPCLLIPRLGTAGALGLAAHLPGDRDGRQRGREPRKRGHRRTDCRGVPPVQRRGLGFRRHLV